MWIIPFVINNACKAFHRSTSNKNVITCVETNTRMSKIRCSSSRRINRGKIITVAVNRMLLHVVNQVQSSNSTVREFRVCRSSMFISRRGRRNDRKTSVFQHRLVLYFPRYFHDLYTYIYIYTDVLSKYFVNHSLFRQNIRPIIFKVSIIFEKEKNSTRNARMIGEQIRKRARATIPNRPIRAT